jgi:hypothetical protein
VKPEDILAEMERLYREQRKANRPYRRAFGRGERWRKILLKVGEARARELDG